MITPVVRVDLPAALRSQAGRAMRECSCPRSSCPATCRPCPDTCVSELVVRFTIGAAQ
jgi:hypothetical protein